MKRNILETLKCQQCFGKLIHKKNKLVCSNCKKQFPISKELVFMGYDENKKDEIEKIINVESAHQTDREDIQKHYNFAYPSFKIGLSSIRILKRDINNDNGKPVAVDVGSGGAPISNILAQNGFDAYRCELDPNSLYSGLCWKNGRLDVGKHIVSDCSLLPFSNNSINVVFCKEFVHHLNDYNGFFNEVNRVLKKGGVFLMIEPTKILVAKPVKHFGHHDQTINKYYSALKKNKFFPYRYYLYYYYNSKRLKFLNVLKSFYNNEIYSMKNTNFFNRRLKKVIQRLIGGSNVLFNRKTDNMPNYQERPRIKIVEPNRLKLSESYLTDPRHDKFEEILNKVYEDLN